MKFVMVIAMLYSLCSCRDQSLVRYDKLVDMADSIVILNQKQHDTIVISADPLLAHLKEILKRNIKPGSPRKFLSDRSISLFSVEKQIGTLMLSEGEKPWVNFRSDSLSLTFPLTYGMGMTLDDLLSRSSP